ncbi:transposase [Micromonospora sp. NBC_01638]|uniref:transposase n=1 Tax=Micromonospora sp. NBC_01638 TaxID=2975982 RepID=UPI003865B93D
MVSASFIVSHASLSDPAVHTAAGARPTATRAGRTRGVGSTRRRTGRTPGSGTGVTWSIGNRTGQKTRTRHKPQIGDHPDVKVYLSQPGLGVALGARVLAEFGDDKNRYADARARKNYAGTSPITRQSGKRKVVLARYVHNDRLVDARGQQAFAHPATAGRKSHPRHQGGADDRRERLGG